MDLEVELEMELEEVGVKEVEVKEVEVEEAGPKKRGQFWAPRGNFYQLPRQLQHLRPQFVRAGPSPQQ